MIDFIVKYWLEVVFGLIALGVSSLAKHYYSLYKAEKQRQHNVELANVDEKIADAVAIGNKDLLEELQRHIEASNTERKILDDKVEITIKELKKIKSGLLSMYKKNFIANCRILLDPSHIITYDEFQNISKEHEVYNSLGGNHDGDRNFEIVKEKYQDQTSSISFLK